MLESNAAYKTIWAACTGALINGQAKGFRNIRVKKFVSIGICRIISVSTIPGWIAYTLTLVPKQMKKYFETIIVS